DLAEDDLAADELGDAGDAWEAGEAEGFEDDAFEDDAFEDDGFAAEEGFEGEGLDDEGFEDDAYEAGGFEDDYDDFAAEGADDYDAWEEAFLEAMDAESDDEFFGALRRIAAPLIQRARPAVFGFLRRHAGRAGSWLGRQAAQRLGVNPQTGAQWGGRVGSWLG